MKRLILSLAVLISVSQIWAQLQRSDEFHSKYKLTGVAVFSRHNIRAPLAAPGSAMTRMTPHTWYDFGVPSRFLTMKGGILETTNGQFFRKWVVSEGLFKENEVPTDQELYVESNSAQRTIATARNFASGFMPMKDITVNHEGVIASNDRKYISFIFNDVTPEQLKQIKAEYNAVYSKEKIKKVCKSLKPNFDLLSDILDVKNSAGYKDGSFKGFTDYNDSIVVGINKEPDMAGILTTAFSPVDALVLQYYVEPDATQAAFGKNLTIDQWKMISKIYATHDEIRFASPFVQRYLTRRIRESISDALQNKYRKFTFMCGHDSNIHCILKSLRVKDYNVPDAIEYGTPIGSKIVFEKWVDASGKEYIAVNHVYQTLDQLRNNTLLDLKTRPNVLPIQFEGIEPNADGLIPMDRMIQRLTGQDVPEPTVK